jgi:hypothetical protein
MFDLDVAATEILNGIVLPFLVSRCFCKTAHSLVPSTFDPAFKLDNIQCIYYWTDYCLPDVVLVQSQTLQGDLLLDNRRFQVIIILEKFIVSSQIAFD